MLGYAEYYTAETFWCKAEVSDVIVFGLFLENAWSFAVVPLVPGHPQTPLWDSDLSKVMKTNHFRRTPQGLQELGLKFETGPRVVATLLDLWVDIATHGPHGTVAPLPGPESVPRRPTLERAAKSSAKVSRDDSYSEFSDSSI